MSSNSKVTEKRLQHLERLFNDNKISEKVYDILDACYRLEGGLLTIQEIEKVFIDKTEK